MSKDDLTPAQIKFFTTHINKSLLGKLRDKQHFAFVAAQQSYRHAEEAARSVLAALPMFPIGSTEHAEKDALIERCRGIEADRQSKSQGQVAAFRKGKADQDAVVLGAKALLDRALADPSIPDAERITLLKQNTALHLNRCRDAFEATVAPVLAEIADTTGSRVTLPMVLQFEADQAALFVRVQALRSEGQTAAAALAILDQITAEADTLLARQVAAIESYTASDAMVQTIEMGHLDAVLRAALTMAATYAQQMATWGVADAKAVAADVTALEKRGAALFGVAAFESKTAAATAMAARADLQADVDRLNVAAARTIEAKKHDFGQMLREVESRFAVVERTFRDIDDVTFAKGQKGPIDDVLGLTRTAINDLNGYNTDALLAAKRLVDEAAVIVAAAQKATETNAALTAELANMDGILVQGSRKDNPLAARFSVMQAELATLNRTWQAMLLPDAVRAVMDFRTGLMAEIQLAKALEDRRAASRIVLAAAKADLAAFDLDYGKRLTSQGQKPLPYEGSLLDNLAMAEGWIETKITLSVYDTIDAMLLHTRTSISGLHAGLRASVGKTDDAIFTETLALQRQLDDAFLQTVLGIQENG